jgi:hypothetical protein
VELKGGGRHRGWIRRIDGCKATGYGRIVRIRSFVQKGLRKLYLDDSTKGLPAGAIDKLRNVDFPARHARPGETKGFSSMESPPTCRRPQGSMESKRHAQLAADVPIKDGEIFDVNFEDYH